MNNKRAREIRKQVYGKEGSPRYRKYHIGIGGNVIADKQRQEYQGMKKEYKREAK